MLVSIEVEGVAGALTVADIRENLTQRYRLGIEDQTR